MQIGKRIENTHRASFSEEELNLLLNAADDGEVFVTKSFGVGTVIHVGGFEYGSRDPATAAQYLEAIEKMRRNRLVICTSKDVYQLTGTGFKIAREIKSLLDSGGV